MADEVEDFARRILGKYESVMAYEDLEAGEFEVAAISVVEMAPVSEDEIDELMSLAAQFEGVDAEVAPLVAQKARQRLHPVP